MNFFYSFSSKRKFTVPADKKGESAKHFGDGVRTEFVVLLGSNFGAENCLFSGERPLGNHADFLYHMADVDRHAKSRTLNAADRRSLLACKRFKEVLLEFPAHADAVVADVEFVERIPFFIVRFLNNTDNDGAAVLCEFRGIAQQIQQNLVQAELVAEDNRNPPVL